VKKDIDIPQVKNVFIAAVREKHEEYGSLDWNIYLINDRAEAIEGVLIVSKGYDGKKETSTMRHSITNLPPQSFAKVEFLQDDVLQLNNEFSVSFFAEGKMFHKKFVFQKNSINEKALQDLPVMPKKGVLLK
jgi:glucan biosynthesis protein